MEFLADYPDGDVIWLATVAEDVFAKLLESFFLASADSWDVVADTNHSNSSAVRASRTSGRL
jgi:hypothetical protein